MPSVNPSPARGVLVCFRPKAFESSAEYGNHRASPVIRWWKAVVHHVSGTLEIGSRPGSLFDVSGGVRDALRRYLREALARVSAQERSISKG
jgi:hypothetical protein